MARLVALLMSAKDNQLRIVDSVITIIAVFCIAMMTRQIGAIFILVAFGIWNFWTGGRQTLNIIKKEMPGKIETPGQSQVTRAMLEDVKSLKPGQSMRYVLEKEKLAFVVMDADDFDHVLSLAKLEAKEADKIKKER